MKIIQVKDRTLILIEQLVELWEKSVKETHLFLSEDEIESIKKYKKVCTTSFKGY